SVDLDFFVEFGTLDVPAGFDCGIDYYGSGSHLVNHLGCDDYRSLPTEDLSSRDYDIRLSGPSRHDLALFSQLLWRQGLRIIACGFSSLAKIRFNELRSQRFDLFFDSWSSVEGLNGSPKPSRRSDRLKPGNSDADHQNAQRFHRARRCHHHRKD